MSVVPPVDVLKCYVNVTHRSPFSDTAFGSVWAYTICSSMLVRKIRVNTVFQVFSVFQPNTSLLHEMAPICFKTKNSIYVFILRELDTFGKFFAILTERLSFGTSCAFLHTILFST